MITITINYDFLVCELPATPKPSKSKPKSKGSHTFIVRKRKYARRGRLIADIDLILFKARRTKSNTVQRYQGHLRMTRSLKL